MISVQFVHFGKQDVLQLKCDPGTVEVPRISSGAGPFPQIKFNNYAIKYSDPVFLRVQGASPVERLVAAFLRLMGGWVVAP